MAETKANPAKQQTVTTFAEMIDQYPIIGSVNMEGLPARQLQEMREKLRDSCVIKMTKRRLMRVAFKQAKKKGIDQLEPHLKGMPALLFTKENPFTLFKILKQNKSPAPAKGGQEAPNDVVIPAAATPFAPGPIISELGKFGLKTGVENGKVAVKEAKVVASRGDIISDELAALLTKLQIYPMEVGLDLTAVYENGMVVTKDILDIDEEQYMSDLQMAAAGALNLGVNAGITNATTLPVMLSVGAQKATSLSVEVVFPTTDTVDIILGKAQAQMFALASHLPDDALSEELKGAAQSAATPTAQTDAPVKEDPKDDDKSSEETQTDAAAGLGALFG